MRELLAWCTPHHAGGPPLRAGLLVSVMAVAFLAGVRVASARQEPKHPASLTGAEWKSYGSREKQAYLNGFLAGAAAEQALVRATVTGARPDSAAVPSAAIATLQAGKQLDFPYAPSVYSVQVDDFYWWADHLSTPIVDVMVSTNRRMRNP